MNIINRKSIAATMILAASVIPAFGQFRGHGSERGAAGHGAASSARPQFEQRSAPHNDSFRNRPTQSQPAYRSPGNFGNAFRGEPAARNNAAHFERSPRGYGYGGPRRVVIPQSRFYSSFGRDHFFRIGRPVFYGRYPRFQYGGFWFSFVGAPPAYWGPDWYYNDDVYIDYSNGGYYLYDNRYPGQGVPLDVDNGDYGNIPPDEGYDNSYSDGYNNSYPDQY